jgi:hypothetical protein
LLFFAAATVWLWLAPESRATGWIAVAMGFVGLFAADQLYGVLPSGPGHGHSASVMWTGILLTAIAAGEPGIAAIVGLARLAAFARLRWAAAARGRPSRLPLVTARAALTLAALVSLVVPGVPGGWAASFALALGGDAVDRCLYYMELERETPRRQMDLALAGRIDPKRDARRGRRPVVAGFSRT